MPNVLVIQNQHGHYLGKQQQWLDGHDKRLLFRTVHQDEAVNVIFELSSKDILLRATPRECELDDSKQPIVKAGPPVPGENTSLFDDDISEDEVSGDGPDVDSEEVDTEVDDFLNATNDD